MHARAGGAPSGAPSGERVELCDEKAMLHLHHVRLIGCDHAAVTIRPDDFVLTSCPDCETQTAAVEEEIE